MTKLIRIKIGAANAKFNKYYFNNNGDVINFEFWARLSVNCIES